LYGITFIFIPDKEPKYRTVRSNQGHLATLLFMSNSVNLFEFIGVTIIL